jgi:hypothetical protein
VVIQCESGGVLVRGEHAMQGTFRKGLRQEVGIGGRNELVAGVFEGAVWTADGGFAKCGWWMEGAWMLCVR